MHFRSSEIDSIVDMLLETDADCCLVLQTVLIHGFRFRRIINVVPMEVAG